MPAGFGVIRSLQSCSSVSPRHLCWFDGDAHNTRYVRKCSTVFHILRIADDAVFGFSGVGRLLPRSLIGSNSGLFVHFSSGVPENHLGSEIAVDRFAIFKELDARLRRRIKPIVRLSHHRRDRHSIARSSRYRKFISSAWSNRARAARSDRRAKNRDRLYSLSVFEGLGEHAWIAV